MQGSYPSRIYRLKLLLIGASLLTLALVSSALGDWLESAKAPHLLTAIIGGLSDVFLVTGAIGIAVDFFTGRDKDAADTERTRSVLEDMTPDFTDAVLKGFSSSPEDLRRLATPLLSSSMTSPPTRCRSDSVTISSLKRSTRTYATRRSGLPSGGTTSR